MRVVTPEQMAAAVGEDLGVSDWATLDQAKIDAFAEVTGDRQFIHTDPVRAAQTPFGGTIAHGMLTLSMIGGLLPDGLLVLDGLKMGLNYGFERVRFLAPVKTGKRVRARHRFLGVEDKGNGRFLTRTEVTIEIEGEEKPAVTAEWLGMQIV